MAHIAGRFIFGRRAVSLFAVAALLLTAGAAQATTLTLTSVSIASTGVPGAPGRDANYLYEYAGTSYDPSINPGVLVPGADVQAAYIMDATAWPINPALGGNYAAPTHTEEWISPLETTGADGHVTAAAGYYIYQTSFYLAPSVNLSTVLIWGGIASDNCTIKIAIDGTLVSNGNRNSVMVPGTCLTQETTFAIGGSKSVLNQSTYTATTSSLHPGWNTIQFVVLNNNAGNLSNPSSLLVWAQAQGMATPEASTAGLLIAGLAGLAWLRRRSLRRSA